MHRKPIADLLAAYALTHPSEQAMAERYVHFVQTHVNCFDRSLLTGHVTGSAWLVNTHQTHVLLTHHRKLNMWLQLGGHADGNPDIVSVARREAQEESGIQNIALVNPQIMSLDIHEIPKREQEPAHYHYDVTFAFKTINSDEFNVSEESHALEWIEISKLHERTTEDSMVRMAEKWKLISSGS